MANFEPATPTSARWTRSLLAHLQRVFIGGLAPTRSSPLGPPASAGLPQSPLRVMVVDDNPEIQMLTAELLSQWGIKPLLASDGAEAVALACERRLDLILMDLQMPILDGLGATQRIRRFERECARARVPIVAFASSTARLDQSLLRNLGVDALLDKPCSIDALRQCLARWCPASAASAASAGR